MNKVTWYKLVRIAQKDNGVIAYAGSEPLYRVWLPSKIASLCEYMKKELDPFLSLLAGGDISEEEWNKYPTIKKDEDVKPLPPVSIVVDATRNSPNCSAREKTISRIVLHNTYGNYADSVDWLCNPEAEASAHLVISRTGKVTRLVPDNKAAWHAGNRGINHESIGIEIEATPTNTGMTAIQEACLIAWINHFATLYKVDASRIEGHRKFSATSCPVLIWDTEGELRTWVAKIFGKVSKPIEEPKKLLGTFKFNRKDDIQLTTNFHSSEVQCKCGVCGVQTINMDLLNLLQKLRVKVGSPIIITSAYRCTTHNSRVGGVFNSLHIKGNAVDIYVEGMSTSTLAGHAKSVGFNGGFGYGSNFLHLDVGDFGEWTY